MKRCLSAVVLVASMLFAADNAHAQNATALPPALNAAVQSGNQAAIDNAIATLSGGDANKASALAVQVIAAAERMLAINPKLAVAVAAAAVQDIKSAGATQAASANGQTVITTAARIFINPAAELAAPDQVAQLATSTMVAATTSNNPALAATVANQAVSTAERILAVDPAAAVQLATVAVEVVNQNTIQQTQAATAETTLAIAKRILINPTVDAAVPNLIQQLSTALSSTPNSTLPPQTQTQTQTQPKTVPLEQTLPDASPT